jgi:SAM-dependent methyltransferase
VLVGQPEALPILSDSLDAVVLPHTLDRSAAPHQVLREVDRCLIPEGHVLILGFDPWGIWGLVRMLAGWRGRAPWSLRFVGSGRLRGWLALLGFDVLLVRPVFYRPPLASSRLLARLDGLERLGGCRYRPPAAAYVLLARKRVFGMTPVRPRWRPRRSLISPGLVKPTSRQAAPLRMGGA